MFLLGLNGICQDSGKKPKTPVSWGFDVDINSKYIWRGITINDGLVIQPQLWASYGNLSGGFWGNLTAYDRFNKVKGHEMDLFLAYDYNLGNFEINHTVMFYFFPTQDDVPNTGELYLGAGYPIGDFKLVSTVAFDFVAYLGSLYFEHGVEYEKALGEKITLGSSALLSWATGKFNDSYFGIKKTMVNLVGLNLNITYNPWGTVYFKPHIQVSKTIDQELYEPLGKYPWFIGLTIGFEK
jgi:hypothetical protein